MIVERPERVRAGVMGISTAYVRLGERHAGGSHPPHPRRKPTSQLPFRIHKTSRVVGLDAEAVVAVHGKELMREVHTMCETAAIKLATTGREVERSDKEKRSFHTGDLYLCNDSLQALQGALGGVCDAVDAVFEGVRSSNGPSKAFVCVRPPGHHCSSDFPSGFCWLNNVHVGIQYAVQKYGLTHAAIIDFDLHHGDGSQEIAWAHNEQMFYPQKPIPLAKRPFIGYYSLHDINSFPCEGGDREKVQNASLCIDNAHGQSIWNVHLREWKTIDEFWHLYENQYLVLLEKARTFLKQQTEERLRAKGNQKPKAAIFISAGFDASEHEGGGMQRHKVNVPTEFYARFTKDIVNLAQEADTSVDGRVISVLEGGYSNKALISGVLSHISGLCEGNEKDLDEETQLSNGLAGIGLSGLPPTATVSTSMQYNTEWWHPSNLDILDHLLDPTPIVPVAGGPKKVRLATYSTPTQASTLKAIDPTKLHLNHRVPSSSRPPSPPVPDVDWEIAASELAQLLIPQDRDTKSHTGNSLAEPRVKKERLSAGSSDDTVVVLPSTTGGRTLRDRKTKVSPPPVEMKPPPQRKVSADRRKTIAGSLPKAEDDPNKAAREPRRRLSAASTVSTTSVAAPTNTVRPRVTKTMSNGALDVKKSRGPATQPGARPVLPQRVSSSSIKKEVVKPSASTQNDVMDDLATSIKKITIRVPSSDEYSARQKKPAVSTSRPTSSVPANRVIGASSTAKKGPIIKSATAKQAPGVNGTKRMSAPASKTVKQATGGSQVPQPRVKEEIISPVFTPPITTPPSQPSKPAYPPIDPMLLNGGHGVTVQVPPSTHPSSEPTINQNSLAQAPAQVQGPLQVQIDQYPAAPAATHQPPPQYSQLQWLAPNSDPVLPTPSKIQHPQQRSPPTFTATGFIPFQAPGPQQHNQQNQ